MQQVLYHEVSKESTACLLKTKVTPSQRVNDKPHETWVCIDKKGGHVIRARCTCKAGKKVQPKPVDMINFDNPKPLRKKRRQRVLSTSVENDDGFDAAEALRSLKRICPSACILTKGDSDTDTASEDEDLPPVLSRFHEVEHESLSPTDLEDKFQRFVRDFQVRPQQVMNLEAMTKGQQDSVLWQRQRRGRITATTAHDVLTLKQATTKSNVLKKIMKYHECDLSRFDAIKNGRQHEETARSMYSDKMRQSHENFNVSDCGLFVDSTFPFYSATPDGLRQCLCHGKGLVEIKCSYKHRDSKIEDIKDQTFFLNSDNKLKTNHRYYSQIQFQMYVSGKTFCDFVVFTYKGITVPHDPEFVNMLIKKCTDFAIHDLVPEIIQHKLN
ncbi:hypothetical protein MAR_017225, partial [Mya arenaria]